MLSAHVRLAEDRDYAKVIDEAAALGEEGLDLAIVYLPPPYDPRSWNRWRMRSGSRAAQQQSRLTITKI